MTHGMNTWPTAEILKRVEIAGNNWLKPVSPSPMNRYPRNPATQATKVDSNVRDAMQAGQIEKKAKPLDSSASQLE